MWVAIHIASKFGANNNEHIWNTSKVINGQKYRYL